MRSGLGLHREQVAAITIFVILIAATAGLQLGVVTAWLFPIPFILVNFRGNRVMLGATALVAALALVMSGFGLTAVAFGIAYYFLATVLSLPFVMNEPPFRAITISTIVFVCLQLVTLARLEAHGIHLFTVSQVQTDLKMTHIAVADSSSDQLVEQAIAQTRAMFSGILIVFGAMVSLICFLVSRAFVPSHVQKPEVLKNWSVPYRFVLLYMIVLVLGLTSISSGTGYLTSVIASASLVLGFVFGMQGLASVWRRISLWPGRRLLIGFLFLLGLFPPVRTIYIVVGLLDANLRMRRMS